jgi:dolichol-phosphate mannosyltransferase
MTTSRFRREPPVLTVVVPTYNECDQIGQLLERVFDACDRFGVGVEVVIVDDNSTDGTGSVADEWARRRSVRVIHRAGKLGLGSAVLDGLNAARTAVVGVMDADLSHPPELLPRLFDIISRGDFDMVVASRYVDGGGTSRFSFRRRLLSRMGCAMARPVTPIRDAMSGFFLIRRERLNDFRTSAQGFKIGLEFAVRSKPRRVAEVGYVFVGRTLGASKMSLAEAANFLKQVLRLYAYALIAAVERPAYVAVGVDRTS